MTDEEEQALIAGAKAGDTQTFQMLVERHERQVYRAAYFILRDPDEAEEIAQEAFMRCYKAIRKFKEDQPFRPLDPEGRSQPGADSLAQAEAAT